MGAGGWPTPRRTARKLFRFNITVKNPVMTANPTVPYHFRTYKDGRYSFVEYDEVGEVTKAIDFARYGERDLVDNLLVWGSPGREMSGYITDADFEHPAPAFLKIALIIIIAALLILLALAGLTRWVG